MKHTFSSSAIGIPAKPDFSMTLGVLKLLRLCGDCLLRRCVLFRCVLFCCAGAVFWKVVCFALLCYRELRFMGRMCVPDRLCGGCKGDCQGHLFK